VSRDHVAKALCGKVPPQERAKAERGGANKDHLIVSNGATYINGAGRITHRIMMRPSLVRRMQLIGAYRDVELPATGMPLQKDAVKRKIDQTQGIAPQTFVERADQEREFFECYCEIEVPGFEHTMTDEKTGEVLFTGLPTKSRWTRSPGRSLKSAATGKRKTRSACRGTGSSPASSFPVSASMASACSMCSAMPPRLWRRRGAC
jgi:hypothetical protein